MPWQVKPRCRRQGWLAAGGALAPETAVSYCRLPLYEYACRSCGKEFETLIRKGDTPACPACASTDLEKRLSGVAIKSDTTHGLALKAAKRRDAKRGSENARAQREYELKHND